MAEILGVGCTHRPVMLRRNEDWTGIMKVTLDDPDMPEAMKNPANWPEQLGAELGNDWGASAARRLQARPHRHVGRRSVREFQGGHRPALRGARLRGPGHPALGASAL